MDRQTETRITFPDAEYKLQVSTAVPLTACGCILICDIVEIYFKIEEIRLHANVTLTVIQQNELRAKYTILTLNMSHIISHHCFLPSFHPDVLPVQPPCSSDCPHGCFSHPVLLAGCQRIWKLSANRRLQEEMLSMCSPCTSGNVPQWELCCAIKAHTAGRDIGCSEVALVAETHVARENKTRAMTSYLQRYRPFNRFQSPQGCNLLQRVTDMFLWF